METVASALVLLARLLVMGPDGTRLVSEHRARIPPGASGLLRETLAEPGLPQAVTLRLTPSLRLKTGSPPEGPAGASVALRSELWVDARSAAAGARPDESNVETITLQEGAGALVQIAEDLVRERRLVLSLSLAPEEEGGPPARRSPPLPVEVAFRVEAFRQEGGGRELLSTQVLMTLEGHAVRWESALRSPRGSTGAPSAGRGRDERLTLSLLPSRLEGGWIGVEAALQADLPAGAGGGEPARPLRSEVNRVVALGTPIEMGLDLPKAPTPSEPSGGIERYLVVVTPFLPAALPAPPGGR